MALSHVSLSPIAQQQFLTHTPPSLYNNRPTKRNNVDESLAHTPPSVRSKPANRNTVHWDTHGLDFYVKENTAPDADSPANNPKLHNSESLRVGVSKQSQEVDLDFADRKFRGKQRRPQLAAETFLAPEPLTESSSAETSNGWLIRAFR